MVLRTDNPDTFQALSGKFLELLTQQGGRKDNPWLRRELNLLEDPQAYWEVQTHLVDAGAITNYRTRGGGSALVQHPLNALNN